MKYEELLSRNKDLKASRIRTFLIQEGYKDHKCENCNLTEWLNDPIPIELHHIDGNNKNHELNNLQILCPNCHAKTPSYGGKNAKKKPIKILTEEILKVIPTVFNIRQLLKHFGMSMTSGNYVRMSKILEENPRIVFKQKIPKIRKRKTFSSRKTKIVWPEPKIIQHLLWQLPTTKIAKNLNVTDKAVDKFCKKHGLTKPSRGYWAKIVYQKDNTEFDPRPPK